MHTIRYQVAGEEDYAYEVKVSGSGEYEVSNGTYTTEPPRRGTLSPAQESELEAAIQTLGTPAGHPLPRGGNAFEASLTIGEGSGAMNCRFWEGALEQDPALRNLVDLLEKL